MCFGSLSTLKFDQIDFNIKSLTKKNEKMEMKEYVETLLREKIYQNPNKDVHECVQELVYVKRNVLQYDEMIGGLIVKDHVHFFELKEKKFTDFVYGISINDDVNIQIFLGGQLHLQIKMNKDKIFYLPYPIFLFGICYHIFEVRVFGQHLSNQDIKIQLYGIRGDPMIMKKILLFRIHNMMVMSGMAGMISEKNEINKCIQNVYLDFNFEIYKSNIQNPNYEEIHIDLNQSGIIWFHIRNAPNKIYKEELIEKAWHPTRFMQWCI